MVGPRDLRAAVELFCISFGLEGAINGAINALDDCGLALIVLQESDGVVIPIHPSRRLLRASSVAAAEKYGNRLVGWQHTYFSTQHRNLPDRVFDLLVGVIGTILGKLQASVREWRVREQNCVCVINGQLCCQGYQGFFSKIASSTLSTEYDTLWSRITLWSAVIIYVANQILLSFENRCCAASKPVACRLPRAYEHELKCMTVVCLKSLMYVRLPTNCS